MADLPPSLVPSPEQEAMELALDHLIFDPLEQDAAIRAEAGDEETPPLRAYALLDASQSADIPICLDGFSNPARCLFDGEVKEDLGEVAPWLVELTRYSDIWDWFVEEGYGNNWGILLHSRLELPRLKSQMKKFLKIENEQSEVFFFKFYRPNHLNTHLPVFEVPDRARFMNQIDGVYAEDAATPSILWCHTTAEGDADMCVSANLIDIGDPLRIQPASPEDAAALVALAKAEF